VIHYFPHLFRFLRCDVLVTRKRRGHAKTSNGNRGLTPFRGPQKGSTRG
jgi:hypothetical protein